jgi:hypothetical protein
MSALTEKQRNFIIALHDEKAPDEGDGLLIWAAERAGYGNPDGTSKNKTLSVIASRLKQSDSVQAAMAEYARGEWRSLNPRAVRAAKNVMRDAKHRDHGRIVMAAIDRLDAPQMQTMHTVKIEDHRQPTPEAIDRVLKRIEQLAIRFGVAIAPPAIIDGEATEVREAAS